MKNSLHRHPLFIALGLSLVTNMPRGFARETQQTPSALVSKEDCAKALRDAVLRLNVALAQYVGGGKLETPQDLEFKFIDDNRFPDQVAVLGGSKAPVEAWFLAHSGRMVKFFDWAEDHRAYGKNAQLYSEKPQPSWTAEKAAFVAKDYVSAVLGSFPSSVKLARVRYFFPAREYPKYLIGSWWVEWARTNAQGNVFDDDRVAVQLTELYGLCAVHIDLNSLYDDKSLKPIDKRVAIEKAREPAKEILNWPALGGRYWQCAIKGEPTAELKVVNPNYITKLHSIEELATVKNDHARLAWVVTFQVGYAGPPTTNGVPYDGEIYVWIDAETGEFLGGDGK
jgi:hypothetical protein